MPHTAPRPVFHDATGRRWPRLRASLTALAALVSVLFTVFVASVLLTPWLPRLALPGVRGLAHAVSTPIPSFPHETHPTPAQIAHQDAVRALHTAYATHRPRRGRYPSLMPIAPPPVPAPAPAPVPAPLPPTASAPTAHPRPLAIGFYVNWDDSSYASLRRNLAQLDWVVPEWTRLQDTPDPLHIEIEPRALDLLRRANPRPRVLVMLQNFHDEAWDGALAARTLNDPARRTALIASLTRFVDAQHLDGVTVDLESIPTEAQPALLAFVQQLHAEFHPRGWLVTQAVPFDDEDYDYRAYSAATDDLMLMAYDEHWEASDPGPVAPQDWFETTLAARMREMDPAHAIVCVGGYGYDWTAGERPGRSVSFEESLLAARDSHASIAFDGPAANPSLQYADDDDKRHQVFFLDAVTAYNQVRAARAAGVAGVALWRLGSEDPGVWPVFARGADPSVVPELARISFPYDVEFEGTGEVLRVAATPQDGAREIHVDPASGRVDHEQYTHPASPFVIRRSGDRTGMVALTFDDGPDPEWTPQILDVLAREGVKATFFIIGENAEAHPNLLRRIVAEGHDVGNHTYTHPNLGEVSPRVTQLELNATQRLIEAVTGRSTTLFRPPYFGDAEPEIPEEVNPIVQAESLGYVTIGLKVDPNDWQLPGAAEITRRTVDAVMDDDETVRGNVVLLHDGGGDRAQTLEALPGLIHTLRARGMRLVPVSELMGVPRDTVMPLVPARERVLALGDRAWFYGASLGGWLLHWIFVVGLGLGVLRSVFVTVLALVQKFRTRSGPLATPRGGAASKVSVLVPAFNEEKVIARTVESLLASTYEAFEILVIDDGSKDRTSEVIRERFGNDPRVRLFTKANSGKADSLNFGLREATGEVIIALDADTIFPPEVLGELVNELRDPRVGAVAGNAKVGNRVNLITRWQALEYITSQNLDRRAFALLNCITVVPGAVGAWRRDVLEKLGGFESDTLAEDQDLTLKVLRLGYEIRYAENAVAWTEAPDSVRALAKQRFRWSFGTLQCMWKHRDALLRPRYGALGFIAMPNVWLFQILFSLMAPLTDLILLRALVWAISERLAHPLQASYVELHSLVFYYALFLLMECASAIVAFSLERREQWSLLGWLLLQRFCYRQVMYWVMFKSVFAAARGGLVGWGKLERKATVAAGVASGSRA